jgi:hypothetical protein
MSTAVATVRTTTARRAPQRTRLRRQVAVTTIRTPARRRARRNRARNVSQRQPNHLDAYCQCLSDPICCPTAYVPVPSPQNSFLARAVQRYSLTVNADGSFAAIVLPTIDAFYPTGAGLYTNASGAAGTTWVARPWANAAIIQGASVEARVVGFGMKILTQVPATSAPGFLYSGTLNDMSLADFGALSPNFFASLPMMKQCLGNMGAFAFGRPEDIETYEFQNNTLGTASNSYRWNWAIPTIAGIGLPASSTVVIEAALALECLPRATNALSIDAAPNAPSVDRPSVEPSRLLGLARTVTRVTSGALDAVGSTATTVVNDSMRAAASAFRTVTSPLVSSYNNQQSMRLPSTALIPFMH